MNNGQFAVVVLTGVLVGPMIVSSALGLYALKNMNEIPTQRRI
jgi:hypothetical protein